MSLHSRGFYGGLAFLVSLLAALYATILFLNDGVFLYILDDPYIHLALAENILRGHYGVNPGEVSAPSSSILWPFLLAPFQAAPLGAFAPLLLNVAFGAATLAVVHAALVRVLGSAVPDGIMALLLAVFIAASHLAGVIFMGMEHILQVWLTAAAALGLMIEAREDRVPRWLPAVLVLGPLVRYENLAVSLPAVLYLALRKRLKPAIGTFVTLAALMGAFSVWLLRNGLHALPTSIMAKAGVGDEGMLWSRIQSLSKNVSEIPLLIFLLLLVGRALFPAEAKQRLFALTAAATITVHILQGRYGAAGRYQLYALVFAALACLHLYGSLLAKARDAYAGMTAPGRAAALAVLSAAIPCILIALGAHRVPVASNNIYEQQFQMRRFAVGFHKKPVAVNDLGLLAYRNDRYVLDLWGLASVEALRYRKDPESGYGWADSLARAHGVDLAMVYDRWLAHRLPPSWVRLGALRLGRPRVSTAYSEVAFYATHGNAVSDLSMKLHAFRKTLPSQARFVFDDIFEERARAP